MPASQSGATLKNKALFFETLETRLLLNADLPGVDLLVAVDADRDHDLLVRMIEDQKTTASGSNSVTRLEVVDLSNGNEILGRANVNTLSSLTLELSGGDDRITVDTLSFADHKLPAITLLGGGGHDQLVVEALSDTVWEISGDNAGRVSGPLNIDFDSIETLTGSANNRDTFILGSDGTLSGSVDGGAAGYDVLEVEGSYTSVTSTVFDAASGVIDLDGKLITYAGLEPVTIQNALQFVLLGTSGDDDVVLEATNNGSFQLRSDNGTFETHIFSGEVQTIVLGLSTGNDSFTSTLTSDNAFDGNLLIQETANLTLGDISGLAGNLTIDTLSALNEAEPGQLDWDGSSVTIADNAVIELGGDLSITVNANTVQNASTIQEFISAPIVKGTLVVGENVSINAGNIDLLVNSNNERQMFLGIDTQALIQLALDDAKVAELADGWGTLTFASNGVITRAQGSWLDDGFAIGQDIQISLANNASHQTYNITDVTATTVSVALSHGATMPFATETEADSGIQVTGYGFDRVSGTDALVFGLVEGSGLSGIARQVPSANPDATLTGNPGLDFVHSDSGPDSIVRAAGTWLEDGFKAGQTIAITNAGANNGTYTIAATNGTVLTLMTGEVLQGQLGVSDAAIRGHQLGSFIDDGFAAGDLIVVQNAGLNNGTYTISAVTDTLITLSTSDVTSPETLDLSADDAPNLIVQVVKNDLALANVPLVLMDASGNVVQTSAGDPLSFTQQELEAAYAASADSAAISEADVLAFLADNPITDLLGGFGLKVWWSDVSGSITLGQNASLQASGDVTIQSTVQVEAAGSTPSIVAGASVVGSVVDSSVTLQEGVMIEADGHVVVDATAENTMESKVSVTSGSIQNPGQSVISGITGSATESDPTGFSSFTAPLVSQSFLGPLGFIRVPGPSLSVAVGIADTDSSVHQAAGGRILASSADISATNTNNYAVEASSTVFQPGANMGVGIGVAIGVNDSDSTVTIDGDVITHVGQAGDINISASSVNETNSVSSAAWVREVPEPAGGAAFLLGQFNDSVKNFQNNLRNNSALSDLTNENPGKFEMAAAISVLVSANTVDVIISSKPDATGNGGVVADGNLTISSYAEQNPGVGAGGCAESGGEVALAGGIAFARYDNSANVTVAEGAQLQAGGAMSLAAEAQVPNQITLDDTFVSAFTDAEKKRDEAIVAANGDADAIAEANVAFNEDVAAASQSLIETLYDALLLRKWGLGGLEGSLFTTYINSGAGGEYASNAQGDQQTVLDANGRAVLNGDGTAKTTTRADARQASDYALAGNINIFEVHNQAEVVIQDAATLDADDDLTIASKAEAESVNVTGLTSVWDIFWSRFGTSSDDGASTSGAKAGVGASVAVRVFDNTARSKVYGNSELSSSLGSVAISSNTRDLAVNLNEMGSDGGEVGIAGSVAVDVISTTTETLVDESARLSAWNDVSLTADSDFLQINVGLAGTRVDGGVAIGAAISVDVIDTTTQALVMDLDGSVIDNAAVMTDAALANIQAGHDVFVTAAAQQVIVGVQLAGAMQADSASDSGSGSSGPKWDYEWSGTSSLINNNSSAATRGGSATSTDNGKEIGAAGAASAVISSASVHAAMGAGSSVNAGNAIDISADFDADTILVEGGGLLDLTAEGTDLAIAGAVGVTVFTRDVDASVQNAIVYGSDLTVAAAQRDLLVVVSAGGAGGAKTDTAVGISGNINVLENQIDAEINGGFIRLDHDARVSAESDTLLVSVAGALGFTLDGTGVGAAIGISHANSNVSALINDADIEAGHDVLVYAHHGHQVVSVVASAGIGLENAGAGQLSLHLLTGDTDARIGGDSQIQADNNIGVIADGQVQMTTVTGGLALGGDLAVGVSLSSSDIYQRRVTATVGDGVSLLSGSQADTTPLGKAQLGNGYAGDTLTLNGVLVSANAADDIINIVVGVALSEDQALQGSVLVDTNETYVYSGIGTELYTNGQGMAMYRAAGSSDRHAIVTTDNGGDIQVQSSYDYLGVNIVGGVAGSISKFAVGASLDVSVHWREVAAEIGGYSVLDAAGSVRVDAQLHATHVYVIFNAGLSGGGSAGAGAVSVPIYNDTVNAFVGGHAHLVAGDDVAVIAGHEFEHTAVNVALAAAGGNFAGGVSLGVVVQNDTVHASVGNDAVLEAGDTILVAASSDAKLADASGGIAVGGKAGAGASAFLLVRNDDVRAEVATGAALTGLALGTGLTRSTAAGTTTYRGVGVVAESREKLVGVAIQGSGGGTAGVAGAVPVSVITETTLAHVHDGVSINAGHNIYVTAKDDTELYNIAGNVAGGGTAAVGASIDIASVTKNTRASLGDPDDGSAYVATDIGVTAEAGGNIVVEAFANEQIVSVAVGIAGAGTAAVGLNGSVYVLGLNTHAAIGENADVLAEGSVVVDALQDTEIDMIGASLAGAGTAAIVGTFDIPIVTKAVTATVLDGAEVVARGNLAGITTHTGTVSSNASGAGSNFINTETGGVSTPTDVIDGSLNLSIPQVDQSEAGMYLARDYSADTVEGFTGVSVTATSLDDLQAITGGIAIAGNAGIAVVAGVDVADITTHATVADGVTINLNSDGLASENQSVTIAAGSALDHMGVLAAIALSGGGSVSLVGDVKALTTDTRASVGDADVYANNDIVITADTEEDLQSLVLSIAGGYIAVSPAVTVISLDATTSASVAAGAMLDADNNVLIVASHDTNIDTLNGGVAGGVGAVSPGVGVMVVEKTTTATVGDNAQVDARALYNSTDYNSTDGIQGLAVKATSSENLDQVAFGAAGGIVAVGGSAAVLEVDSDTIAGINGGARINQKGYSAGEIPLDQQNVEVSAHNVLEVDVVSGGMGIGLIGAGVGVGVLTVNNDTAAYLNGSVSAKDDVSVTALSDQNVHGVIFGGAGGAGALAVAVGIFDIGGDKSGSGYTYTDGNGEQVQSEATTAPSGEDENDSSTSDIDPSTDSKNAINSGVGELLSNLGPGAGSSGDDNLDKLNTSSSDITTQVEAPPTANISTTNSIPTGTSALIGANAVITSTGGNVTVLAYQNAEFEAVVGGAAIGGVAASGGVGVATLDNDVLARISEGGIIYAVGDVSVSAVLNEQAEFTGFAGAGAIGVALSATVVSLSDYSSVTAELGGTILQAGDVSVLASSNIGLYAETIQISAAAFGAGGGAATIVSSDGHTSAALLDGTVIGNVDTPTAVENVTVQAIGLLEIADIDRGSGDNNAMATGGSAGGIAVSVGYSGATDKRDTLAYIGANADVTAYSKVEVQADSVSNLDIVTKGGAGGAVATGLMFANALITDSYTSATIKSNSRVRATDITVAAKGDKLANAQTLAVAIGGVAVGGTNATTEVVANVDAAVDTAVEMIADQSITVKAESDIEGDAFVEAVSVGIVSAGGTDGIVTVTPTTTVAINDNARLSSGGGIAVYTKAGQAEVLVSTEVNNDYLLNDNLVKINRRDVNTEQLLGYQIDPATGEPEYELDENGEPTDTVILVYGNSDGSWRTAANDPVPADAVQMLYEILNLQTGDVIQLHEVGTPSADPIAEPVGGEYLDRNLSVIRIDRETVSIGTVILGQDFDVDRDTITVQQPHNFVTGDVATITDPQALVFDGNSINYDNEGTIRVPANAIYIPNHGLQNGDAFVYSAGDVAIKGLVDGETYYAITRGSDYLAFAASVEDTYSGVQRPIDLTRWGDQDGSIAVSGNLVYGAGDVRYADWVSQDSGQPGNSFYIPEHSLATGDTVTFAGVEGVGSNWAGKTFYVIAQGSDFIQLAQTRGDALMGQVFDLEVTFEPALYYFTQSQFDSSQVNVTDNSILLENFTFAIGDQVRYLPGDDSVGGLSGEDSYRVASVDGQWVTFETLDSTPVDITSVGNGSIAISNVVDFHPQWITGDDYNLDDNHLDDNNLDNDGREIPPNSLYDPRHSLQTGDQVRVSVPAQSGISGLTHNAFYFVIVTGDYLQFSSSLDNALAGIEIDLSASTATTATYVQQQAFDYNDVQFDAGVDQDATFNNSIRVAGHSYTTGMLVEINTGDVPVAGLSSGAYYAMVIDENHIRLATSQLNADTGVGIELESLGTPFINASGVLEINLGEQRITPLLDDGLSGQYRVTVIDNFTFKLQQLSINNASDTLNNTDFDQVGVNKNPGDILWDGGFRSNAFQVGDYITYYEDGLVETVSASILGLVAVEIDFERGNGNTTITQYQFEEGSNNLYVPAHGYITGDIVEYQSANGNAGGLTAINPGRYSVVVVDENLFTLHYLVADGTHNVGDEVNVWENIEWYESNPGFYGIDEDINPLLDLGSIHKIVNDQVVGVDGLIHGHGYYVIDKVGDDGYLNLSLTRGGEALVFVAREGSVTFSREGLDLSRSWGEFQALLDFSDLAGKNIELMGADGIDLSEVLNDVGDSKSSLTLRNTSGGAINAGTSVGQLDINVTLDTTIEGELLADGSIRVDSENKTFGAIDNQLVGIGVLGGGKRTESFLDYTENQTIHITDAVLDAGYSMVIKSETAPNMTTVANGRGGGLVDLNFANADTTVNIEQNKIFIDGTSQLLAGGREVTDFDGEPLPGMSIQAITGGLASNSSTASNGGVVAGLQINARGAYKTSFTANTGVSIVDQASLEAYELLIEAKNIGIDLDSTAHLSMGGLFAGGTAAAIISSNLTADITLGGAASLTGRDGVKLNALNFDNSFDTSTTMYIIALGGGEGWAETTLTTSSNINAGAGVNVYAGADASDPNALAVIAEDSENTIKSTTFNRMIGAIHTTNTKNNTSTVTWDADVHISAINKAFGLMIDENGLITQADGVTVDGGNGTGYQVAGNFVVDDVVGQPVDYGKTVIEARSESNNREVKGSQGTFFYNSASGRLEIINDSAYRMQINDIDTKGQSSSTDAAEVTINAASRDLDFDIAFENDGSDINIVGLGDVELVGYIDNSKGRTSVTSLAGSIRQADWAWLPGLIESQEILLNAEAGSISVATRLVSDSTEAKLEIEALGDVILLIQNDVLRDNAEFFVNAVNHLNIDTLGDVGILYQSPRVKTSDVLIGGAIRVNAENDGVDVASESGFYSNRYRQGKVDSILDAPITEVKGAYGDEIASMFLATIHADNIRVTGVGSAQIDLRLETDILGDGAIDIVSNGSVSVTEMIGDLRVGRIETSYDLGFDTAVVLAAFTGGVVDAVGDSDADVVANSINISRAYFIGTEQQTLDVENLQQINDFTGISASASGDIYLTQTQGDLLVKVVNASGSVGLETLNGSILAGEPGFREEFDVRGTNISLTANGGYLGSSDYYMDIVTLDGMVNAFADNDIYLMETSGSMNVQSAVSNSDIYLYMGDQNPEVTETTLFNLINGGIISAAGSIEIYAADDFHAGIASRIEAGSVLTVYGDREKVPQDTIRYFVGDMELDFKIVVFSEAHTNVVYEREDVEGGYWVTLTGDRATDLTPDDEGTHILLEGAISTMDGAFIYGAGDEDDIHFKGTLLAGEVTADGQEADDRLRVTLLAPMSNPIASQVDGSISGRDVLNLVGGEGVDDVTVYTHGSGDTSNEYVINVDSDAVDNVVIHGADDSDDIFLMRETVGIASFPGSFNMVSVINGTLTEATTSGGPESVQRINISTNLDRLWVSGGSGDDYFAVDSFIHTELVFAGGDGADSYALGQFFGSKRDAGAQVAALDHFGTTTQTLNGSAVEVSPSSEQPVLILDGYNALTGEFEDKVIVSEAQHVPLGVSRAELKMVGAVLMPGELNEITFETLPDGGEILIDQDALLIVQDTLTSNQASIELEFTAGDSDITGFAFGADLNDIEMIGLDSAASVTWSLVNGALVASNGVDDVLRLDIVADPIVANTSGTVRVTATMMGAFRHESIVNVDSLAITGITLVATDTAAHQTSNNLRVIVGDVSPALTISGGGVNGVANEVLSGSWNAEVGADGLGAYRVTVDGAGFGLDGAGYGLDEVIAIFREGVQIASLQVMSNGVWEITAADLLQDLYINRHYDISFGLTLADSDRDTASAFATVTLSGSKVPDIAAIGEDAFLSVTDTVSTDVNSVELTYTAGGLDLVAVGFDSDLSTIVIEGLDDDAMMIWSIVDGALIGNNGTTDVIKLEVTADRIAALSSGTVTVTATLLGALAHEDNVNVDVLTISGIGLVATDSEGFELQQSATVTVHDSLPAIDAEALIPQVLQGETISGTWAFDAGADGLGGFGVSVDGVDYTLDSPIALYGDGRQIGALTVASDGTWQLVALADLWTVDGAAALYDLSVEIRVIDRDQDAAAVQFDLAVEVPAVVFAQIDSGVVVVDEDLIVDETSIDLAVKTGTFALATVAFDTDTSSIQIDGLDDAAAISWRIDATGALIGHDGTADVIRLTLAYDNLIQAESDGVVRLTATLLGAMSHEDFVNVDSLSISGVALILKDGWGYTVTQTVGVTVLDDQPVVGLSSSDHIGNDKGGEVHSGSWNVDMGADAGGTITALVNGQEFAVGETIEWFVGTDYVGDLTLLEDGSWTFVAQKKTYDETALVMDMSFELIAIDADGDRVAAQTTFTVTRNLGRANNGVGNGLDPQPPGNPPENDTNTAVPGSPGNQGGADYDSDLVVSTLDLDSSETQTLIMVTAAGATPSVAPQEETDEIWFVDDASTALERLLDAESAPLNLVSEASMTAVGEEWTVL